MKNKSNFIFSKNFYQGPPAPFSRHERPPIPYLILEPSEISKAQPVPAKQPQLRALCKGSGTLRISSQGMVYLEVQKSLLSNLKIKGLKRPPYLKAHIPVILPREMSFHSLQLIEQLGKQFSFEIEGLYSTEPVSWPEMEQVWFFKIRSPELEKLRRRLFLLNGHPFHVVVAVKPRKQKPFQPLMRINPGVFAA